jgi:NADPH-dependent curcumin reductase CurA
VNMTAIAIPTVTRQVHLASRPGGTLTAAEFRVVEAPLGPPEPGHVVVRNTHLALAAVMRERMDPDAELPPALSL